MSTYLIEDTTLSSIADAIRTKAGTSSAFSPAQMVSAIENLPSGGGQENEIINRTINGTYRNSTVVTVGSYAFAYCSALTSINLSWAMTIGNSAFAYCSKLTSAKLPWATTIGSGAFYYCSALTAIDLSKATTIENSAFQSCYTLACASLPKIISMVAYTFRNCYRLLSLYLTGSSMCTLRAITAFTSTPISNYTTSTGGVYGSIYVPASLYNSYKTATNWAGFSNRFVSI